MQKGRVSVNIIANLIGKVWVGGIGLILAPVYIKFLGIESYGLVGFYGTLIGSMTILDMGLSTTLNRELAKARAVNADPATVRNMVYSLERIYWIIGLLIAVSVVAFAPAIARHWVNAEKIPAETVQQAIMLMGLVVAFQWPISLYNGGLLGLERQVLDNVLMVTMTTIRAAGILVLFIWIKPSILFFFVWQAIISLIYVLLMRTGLWHYLPKALTKPRFSKEELLKIWRFAAGMTGISLITFFISQADKVVLSKMLPLTEYGYYILSFTVATSLSMLVAPVNAAFFPRLSGIAATSDETLLRQTYHRACRLVATVVFPVGLILIFFTDDVLRIWTGNAETVKHTSLMIKILVAGSVCNSLMVIPYLLILARGRTKFVIYQNLIAAIILLPLLFWWTARYGSLGATFVWLSVNAGYILFSIPVLHQRMLKGELQHWYINDTLLPLLMPLALVSACKAAMIWFFPDIIINFFTMAVISLIVFGASLICLPDIRNFIKKKLSTDALTANN
ncbi:MAG: oligosaccharide flippase family protein [Bacteroidetes bacterium]|nr:oligosaccharide flippase family protein [Bacteroidota bacterium]